MSELSNLVSNRGASPKQAEGAKLAQQMYPSATPEPVDTQKFDEYIAVLDLEAKGGLQAVIGQALAEKLRSVLATSNQYTVIDRSNMNSILEEQSFQLSDCVNSECRVEVGQLLGAHSLIVGSISTYAGACYENVQLVEVETGRIVKSAEELGECSLEALLIMTQRVANRILGVEVEQANQEVGGVHSNRVAFAKVKDLVAASSYGQAEKLNTELMSRLLRDPLPDAQAFLSRVREYHPQIVMMRENYDRQRNQLRSDEESFREAHDSFNRGNYLRAYNLNNALIKRLEGNTFVGAMALQNRAKELSRRIQPRINQMGDVQKWNKKDLTGAVWVVIHGGLALISERSEDPDTEDKRTKSSAFALELSYPILPKADGWRTLLLETSLKVSNYGVGEIPFAATVEVGLGMNRGLFNYEMGKFGLGYAKADKGGLVMDIGIPLLSSLAYLVPISPGYYFPIKLEGGFIIAPGREFFPYFNLALGFGGYAINSK